MASINHYFWEFDNWVFFAISHKKNYYYAFYNKVSKETEIICLVEPLDLLYPDEELSEPQNEQFAKELSSLIKELKPTDNPVLLKFELK